MMNWDTNGQFKVMDANGSSVLAGSTEDNRAVAVILAPGAALPGQDRTPATGTANCGGNYNPAAYMETANGINNSALDPPSSPAMVTDFSRFIAGTSSNTFNDKLVYITRADIWNAIKKRSDFNNYLRALTRRAVECTAMYGTHNDNGASDKRLPWASRVSLSTSSIPTYAVDSRYNDADNLKSGRMSYRVNSARSDTDNDLRSYERNDYLFSLNSYCTYTSDQQVWYENWKDHLFYAVSNNFKPSASPWSTWCGTCLKINGSGNYAAVVIFAGEKLSGQSRNLATNKGSVTNYLEASNGAGIAADTGSGNYQAATASGTFNDIVYAINSNLTVSCADATGMMRPVPGAAVAPPGNPKDYAACP